MSAIIKSKLPEIRLLSLTDFPQAPEVEEKGETFIENARLKAESAWMQTGLSVIADDGGLVIDALNGAPGVHSHRYLGAETPFSEKMRSILSLLQHVNGADRSCRFVCSVVVIAASGKRFECEGICEGVIATELKGDNGFGYDPIFFLPQLNRHMAELLPEEKHVISHRGEAMRQALQFLSHEDG